MFNSILLTIFFFFFGVNIYEWASDVRSEDTWVVICEDANIWLREEEIDWFYRAKHLVSITQVNQVSHETLIVQIPFWRRKFKISCALRHPRASQRDCWERCCITQPTRYYPFSVVESRIDFNIRLCLVSSNKHYNVIVHLLV